MREWLRTPSMLEAMRNQALFIVSSIAGDDIIDPSDYPLSADKSKTFLHLRKPPATLTSHRSYCIKRFDFWEDRNTRQNIAYYWAF
jgi:hypothetical protein